MNKIFYLMGKSASGKDTIYKSLVHEFPQLKTVTLYTTRPRREGETEGLEYHFISRDKMSDFSKNGKLIEIRGYNTIHGLWEYATVDDGQIDLDKAGYIMMGTLESFLKIKEYFGNEQVIPIYIEVPDNIRLKRAIEREEKQKEPKYQELCRRFIADSEDFSEEKLKGAGIIKRYKNKEITQCVKEIAEVIKYGWV